MLCLSGFELSSRWVPLLHLEVMKMVCSTLHALSNQFLWFIFLQMFF